MGAHAPRASRHTARVAGVGKLSSFPCTHVDWCIRAQHTELLYYIIKRRQSAAYYTYRDTQNSREQRVGLSISHAARALTRLPVRRRRRRLRSV